MADEQRGYCGIGIYHPKKEVNVGSLWRLAYLYGAKFIFTIGRRYTQQVSDTTRADRHIPLYEYESFEDFLTYGRAKGTELVAIEQYGRSIENFVHPERAIYLLGAEDHGLPPDILAQCNHHIEIPSVKAISMNVSNAGAIVLYDRHVRL